MSGETGRAEAKTELAELTSSLIEILQGRLGIGTGGDATGLSAAAAGPERSTAEPAASRGRIAPDVAALSELEREVAGCKRCSLCESRSNVVFGAGSGSVGILFIGEAPGRDEDLQGLPFVGRAGRLLTKIIEAIEFKREDVYIANVLKCRPPGNRNPLPEEVARCRPYLMRQIELLQPKVICTLGVFATQALLETKSPLTVLRGGVHELGGLSVVPTYHPAACLRYPKLKAAVWEDVQLLRDEYLS